MEFTKDIPAGSRVLVAMSGGVDSALTAALLRRAGYECVGVNMRTYHPRSEELSSGRKFQTCCSPEDAADARKVAAAEGFPFYVLDLEKEFEREVVQPFINSYLSGQTPNPCVLCNNHLKLGVLLDKARLYGCDFVATGHYAQVIYNPQTGRTELQRAVDTSKDQTYYLFGLEQEQLAKLRCPLGKLHKQEVREIAREFGLAVHDKPDSQEICFVPENDYRKFLKMRLGNDAFSPGEIISTRGERLGKHEGIGFYTIGQRRGLGVAHSEPLYVVEILADKNVIIVGTERETAATGLVCNATNWVAMPQPVSEFKAEVQIRYRHAPAAAIVKPSNDGHYVVSFREPQRSVAPGQAAVFYQGDTVLGGGWIQEAARQQ